MKNKSPLNMVTHSFNPSTQETVAGGSQRPAWSTSAMRATQWAIGHKQASKKASFPGVLQESWVHLPSKLRKRQSHHELCLIIGHKRTLRTELVQEFSEETLPLIRFNLLTKWSTKWDIVENLGAQSMNDTQGKYVTGLKVTQPIQPSSKTIWFG